MAGKVLELRNKLQDAWSAEKGAHCMSAETVRELTSHFGSPSPIIEPAIKARILLSMLSCKKHQLSQSKDAFAVLLKKASNDEDPWVQMIAAVLSTYPQENKIQIHPTAEASANLIATVVEQVGAAVQLEAVVPSLEACFLDPSIAPAVSTDHQHFKLRATQDPVDEYDMPMEQSGPPPPGDCAAPSPREPRVAPTLGHRTASSLGQPLLNRTSSMQSMQGRRGSAMPKSSKRTMVAIEFEEAVKESDNATKRRRADGQAGRQDRQEAKPAAESAKPAAMRLEDPLAAIVPEPDSLHAPQGADDAWAGAGALRAAAPPPVQQSQLTAPQHESIRQAFGGATNQLTADMRAHITSFLSGDLSAAPLNGNTEEVVLNEEDKFVMEQDGEQVLSHRERIIFEMNYETGKWRKLRRKLGVKRQAA